MKVKELIEKLQKYDPEMEVLKLNNISGTYENIHDVSTIIGYDISVKPAKEENIVAIE